MQERALEFEPRLDITHKLYQQSWDTLGQRTFTLEPKTLFLSNGVNGVTQSLKEAEHLTGWNL